MVSSPDQGITVAVANSWGDQELANRQILSPNNNDAAVEDYRATRAYKRRSSKACVSCHNRKVRCDVVSGGWPCTNCRLDGVDCVLKASNRGRKPNSANKKHLTKTTTAATRAATQAAAARRQSESQQSGLFDGPQTSYDDYAQQAGLSTLIEQRNESLTETTPVQSEHEGQTPSQTQAQSQRDSLSPGPDAPSVARRDFLLALAFEADSRRGTPKPGQNSRQRHRGSQPLTDFTSPTHAMGYRRDTNESDIEAMSTHGSGAHPGARQTLLPPYIKPLPAHLKPRDLNYLADGDCLVIPDDELRDELLRVYIRFVYPFMPATDIDDVIGPVVRGGGSNGVSLLLFQAIMFASITFIDGKLLQDRGFTSRKEARSVYFDRVRILYSFNVEVDRITQIQSLLLMTYWYDSPEDDRDTWYWMGITLSAAQVVGLHRNPQKFNISPREKKLRRRIWWSCVMRDRHMGLGIRRPSRIRDEGSNNPPLSLDDFDLGPASPELAQFLGESKFNCLEVETQTAVASMCIDLCRLSVIIGHILHSQYTISGTDGDASEFLLRTVVRPRRSAEQAASLVQCDLELTDWLQSQESVSLSPAGQPQPQSAQDHAETKGGISRLYRSLVQIIYFTAVGALHRPQAFYAGADEDNNAKKQSRAKVQEAAVALTKLAFDMQSRNLLRYSSTSSIPAFLSATLIHLLNTRSNDEEVRNISVGRFYQCLGALQQLQNMYASAEYAVHFVRTVLHTGQMDTPLLTAGFTSSASREWPSKDQWSNPEAQRTNTSNSYPSPSLSGKQSYRPGDEASMVQQQGTFYVGQGNEQWGTAAAVTNFGGAGPLFDFNFGATYAGELGELDVLDPSLTLMSFDSDPAFLLTRSMTRPAM